MSRNGNGTYNLPAGNPVVTGTTISSTWANNTLADMANAITGSIAADGQTTITGPLKGPSGTVAFAGVGQTKIPSGTTAQRAVSPTDGMIRYNTDLQQYEGYKNGAWSIFGNGAGGTLFSDTVTATQGQTVINTPTGFVLGGDNLSVYVNGSRQIYNVNYTETTTSSFTFTTGLNVGDLVNYTIGASTSLSVNASSVLYNEGSTGAVNTNVEVKLQQSVSIFDFMTPAQIAGVQGHNYAGTDLHVAFQAAFDSAPDSLYIPKGLYPIYQPITITYQTRMYGDGYRFSNLTEGVFIYGSGNFILLTVAARDVIIEGLAFQSGGTSTAANTALIYPTIANVGEQGTYNLRIRDCYFEGGVRQLVASFNPNRLDVQGCHFNANSDTVNCINIVQNTTLSTNPVECYFNNNVFGSLTGAVAASSSAIYLDSVDTFTISKNNFQSYFDGAIDIRKTKTYTNNLINIHDNFIEDMQLYSVRISDAYNVWISNNELSGNIGGTAQSAILATNIDRLLINNNIVQGYLYNGITIYDSAMFTVSGNTISDIGQATNNTYADIYVNNSDEGAISNNVLSGNISQAYQPQAYIKLENTTSKVAISGNEYRDSSVLPLKTDTTPTEIVGYDKSYPYALPYTQSLTFGLVGLSATNQALAIGGTLNLNLPLNTTSGSTGGIAGTLTVSNTWASFFPNNTNAVYAIAGHGTTVTFTPLVSVDGSGAGGAFTVAMSANGVITMTNTSGYVTVANMTFTGSVGIGQ